MLWGVALPETLSNKTNWCQKLSLDLSNFWWSIHKKRCLACIGILIIKIRRSHYRLIFIRGIHILLAQCLLVKRPLGLVKPFGMTYFLMACQIFGAKPYFLECRRHLAHENQPFKCQLCNYNSHKFVQYCVCRWPGIVVFTNLVM